MNEMMNFMLCEFYINKKQKIGVILLEASKEGSAVPANAGSHQAFSHLSGLVVSGAASSQGFIGRVLCFPPNLLLIHTSWLTLQDSVNILIYK